jgi:hypothetical protein
VASLKKFGEKERCKLDEKEKAMSMWRSKKLSANI